MATSPHPRPTKTSVALSLLVVVFGVATLASGGRVLFGGPQQREAAGDYVPFVVWINFVAGLAYVIAGVGLWSRRRWAVWLAAAIATATALALVAFGAHVAMGGAYELRTVGAMTLRTALWAAVALVGFTKWR